MNPDGPSNNAIEFLLDEMNQGMIFVDKNYIIRLCNQKAKQITGLIINAEVGHDAGQIEKGDIVIIADNKLGVDDGQLGFDELKLINVTDHKIQNKDLFIAVGVYGNHKIPSHYKYMREHPLGQPMRLEVHYLGHRITATIDTLKKETLITVNGLNFPLKYYSSIGNMVVLSGRNGSVKFFQAKGYSTRNEDIGHLLRGGRYTQKIKNVTDIDVVDKSFLDFFDESHLSQKLFSILEGHESKVKDKLYEINKRPFICSIIPCDSISNIYPYEGAFLIMQDAELLESFVNDRNDIIQQIQESHRDTKSSYLNYPEKAFDAFVGNSTRSMEVKYMAYKASKSKFNVLITGESGTGKSKLAREIHQMSSWSQHFVEVNCNAIPHALVESELFGYVGGAFTGAKNEGKIGFFETANHGTIFLDEIGELPQEIQVKLLYVLQHKTIYRVGSSKPIKVDVRVIAATNRDLCKEVEGGRFRQDLYYRINVFPIEIPPIRERKDDVYTLINQILHQFCDEYQLEKKQFSGDALQKLLHYNWPGNVRELENVIERAITLCESEIIYPEHLNLHCPEALPNTMKELIEQEERRIIERTLMKHHGNKTKTMEELNLSRTVLYEKLKKYKLND